MNETRWFLVNVEQIMRRAIGAGLSGMMVILLAGLLLGWPYGLLIGFVMVFLVFVLGAKK